MADNDRGQDGVNSVDVYLDTIAKHIRVYQGIKKEFPHLAVGADDLIRSLKQLEKDFMIVKFPEKDLDAGETANGGQPLDDGNEEG